MQERICQWVGGSARGFGLLAVSMVLFVLSGIGLSNPAHAQTTWHDISASVSIDTSNPLRNRRSPDARVSVEITNTGGTALAAPLRLVLGQFTSGSVSLQGETGTNADGDPYLDLTPYIDSELAAGASSGVITLTILGGGRSLFSFFPRVEQEQTVADEPLTVQITTPATLLTVGVSPVTIEGTISSPDAVLTVNGATVAHANGQFSAAVSLEEGLNNIVVRAVQSGEETTDSIVVSLDATPPYVTIDTPADGGVVYTASVSVSGLVNDIVRGTISEGEANVTVNGVVATVSNRSYLAQNIPLNEGDNSLTVTASDQVGNVGNASITVRYVIPKAKRIERVSGQDQQAGIHTVLAEPLVVKLLGSDGSPVVDQGVVFRVTQGNGLLAAGTADEAQGVLIKTDANGLAQTTFRLGSRAGEATHRVRARAVGYDGEAIFHASATTNPGDKIGVIAGNNQRGAISQPLPNPLIVAVTDDGANLVANASVEFKVTKGGGSFQNGETTYTTQTDSDGRASVEFILGDEPGLDVQRVMATLVGTEASAGFTASGLIIGDPGHTSITGVVLDNQDNPVPGVTIRVEDTTREAITDEQGQFTITEAPVGPVHLLADGSTATVAGEWPTLSYNIVTIAGAENPLSAPIYMVKLDTENAVTVGDEDVVYTLPEMPGFKLTVKAGSVTFPDGSKSGQISVTAVNANKVPMPPPNGMQPQFIVTIQPAGAKFDPPAPLSIPNVDGHLPGAQVEMYSYDHDLEEFVAIGLGTVSKDGSIIETNPGVGVIKAGWHCGSQPGGSGCCDGGGGGNCGYCYDASSDCNNTNCTFVPDRPLQNQSPTDCKTLKCSGWDPANETPSTPDTPKDCKKPVCENGSPTQVADAGDKPDDIPNDCKKPACDGMNPTTEDDDNDWPPPNDNDAKCKKCQDGSPIADPSKNADGVNYQCSDADSCFVCQSGSCSRKPDVEHDTIVPVGVNVSQLINILNGATSGVRSICAVAADPSINGEISGTLVERCCEGDFNNAARLNGSVSWQQPAIQCRIPTPLTLGGVVTIGVAVNFGGSAQITGSGIFADCDCSYNVSLAGNLRLEAGVALIVARLDPSVFDVTGVGSAVAQVSGSLDCNGLNYNGGQLGPLQIIFRVTLGSLITKEYQHTFNDLSWNF